MAPVIQALPAASTAMQVGRIIAGAAKKCGVDQAGSGWINFRHKHVGRRWARPVFGPPWVTCSAPGVMGNCEFLVLPVAYAFPPASIAIAVI